VVTVVLAGVAVYGAILTRRALQAASQDVQEAIKAQIDQQAPRVAIVAEAVGPPTLFWKPGSEEISLISQDQSFEKGSERLALTGWLRLENEGKSTAIVRLPPDLLALPRDERLVLSSGYFYKRPTEPASIAVGAGFGQFCWSTWSARSTSGRPRRRCRNTTARHIP
jgi:hypothetical protein